MQIFFNCNMTKEAKKKITTNKLSIPQDQEIAILRKIVEITNSELDELVVTNTVPLSEEALACSKIRQLSIAELLAETMRRIYSEESVSELFY